MTSLLIPGKSIGKNMLENRGIEILKKSEEEKLIKFYQHEIESIFYF